MDEHENVKAIQEENWSLSQEKKLRSFVGLTNYYHHFIQDFSKVARTLVNLLKKWLSQEWDEPCHQAFGELESEFSSPPMLKFASLTNLLRCIPRRVTLLLADG